jgi:hypothetical protein
MTSYAETVWPCLQELEREYLKAGETRCSSLTDRSQLSAFLLLGIRGVSILKAMFRIWEPDFLDSYDVLRRAYIETWQLQFEFRLRDSGKKVQQWFQGDAEAWSSDKKILERYIAKRRAGPAGYGREFGLLSGLAHPTFDAAINSCAIATIMAGSNPNKARLEQSRMELGDDFLGLLNRQIWLSLEHDEELIDTVLPPDNMKMCIHFHEERTQEDGGEGSKKTEMPV